METTYRLYKHIFVLLVKDLNKEQFECKMHM